MILSDMAQKRMNYVNKWWGVTKEAKKIAKVLNYHA